jgi:hypothetical protein
MLSKGTAAFHQILGVPPCGVRDGSSSGSYTLATMSRVNAVMLGENLSDTLPRNTVTVSDLLQSSTVAIEGRHFPPSWIVDL